MPLPPRTRTAFTLVELLVVIGIIALLISILLPALNKAKENANRVACGSNMKQIATGLLMYTNDYGGWFPSLAVGSPLRPEDWIAWQSGRNPDEGQLVRYMSGKKFSPKIYRCPSDDIAPTRNYKYSYTLNYNMTGWGWPGPPSTSWNVVPCKVTKIRNPAEKILVIDESWETIDDGAWAPQHYNNNPGLGGANLLSNRHDKRGAEKVTDRNHGRGNVVFSDFHYDFVERRLSLEERYFLPRWPDK